MRPLPALEPDCAACTALCCMAPAFDAGEEFALDKPALAPCPNLQGHACRLHDRLETTGFVGCLRYDCLGAGQRLTAEVFPGADWQADPELRAPMAEAFLALHRVHAGLELLLAAGALDLPDELAEEHAALIAAYHPEPGWSAQALAGFAASALPRRLADFLTALRDHV